MFQVPDIVRVMDLQQEQLARSMGEGHRVIHGVAGSGKTMILGYPRAGSATGRVREAAFQGPVPPERLQQAETHVSQ